MDRCEAVLLDVDGTLVDSNDAHAEAWVEACAEAGRPVTFAAVRPLIGMGGEALMEELLDIPAEGDEARRIAARRVALFQERHLPHVRPFPRVPALLRRMRAAGLRLVVASSAPWPDLQPLLDRAGVTDLLDGATSADDVAASKPAPDVAEAARSEAGVLPSRAVLLGDTPYDAEAAARAGLAFVGVRCGGWGDADLAPALAVYDDPADLLRRFEASPFAVAAAAGRG